MLPIPLGVLLIVLLDIGIASVRDLGKENKKERRRKERIYVGEAFYTQKIVSEVVKDTLVSHTSHLVFSPISSPPIVLATLTIICHSVCRHMSTVCLQ